MGGAQFLSTNKTLEGFVLFYEELGSKTSSRIRRIRQATSS